MRKDTQPAARPPRSISSREEAVPLRGDGSCYTDDVTAAGERSRHGGGERELEGLGCGVVVEREHVRPNVPKIGFFWVHFRAVQSRVESPIAGSTQMY